MIVVRLRDLSFRNLCTKFIQKLSSIKEKHVSRFRDRSSLMGRSLVSRRVKRPFLAFYKIYIRSPRGVLRMEYSIKGLDVYPYGPEGSGSSAGIRRN